MLCCVSRQISTAGANLLSWTIKSNFYCYAGQQRANNRGPQCGRAVNSRWIKGNRNRRANSSSLIWKIALGFTLSFEFH